MKDIVDEHGRPWDELDLAIQRQRHPCEGSYAVTGADGTPLYGRFVPGTTVQVFYLRGVRLQRSDASPAAMQL